MLRRNPGFATVAVLVLAVGIGANTAIFSLVESVLIRPLPYPNSERLVMVRGVAQGLGPVPSSYPAFLGWREQTGTFDQVAAYFGTSAALTGLGEPEQLQTLRVSANLLSILGTEPALGRDFLAEEEPREATPVVI